MLDKIHISSLAAISKIREKSRIESRNMGLLHPNHTQQFTSINVYLKLYSWLGLEKTPGIDGSQAAHGLKRKKNNLFPRIIMKELRLGKT